MKNNELEKNQRNSTKMAKNNMKIELREVTKKDWDFILNLRNKFYEDFYEQKEPIMKDDHYKYMTKQKSNPNFHQWVALDGEDYVGYTRILDQGINVMVEKKFHSRGIGTIICNLVCEKALSLGIKKLEAVVLAGNESSKKMVITNNFKLKMYTFEKEIS